MTKASQTAGRLEAFQVPRGTHYFLSARERYRKWWCRLGNFESSALQDRLDGISIEKPIYICGLPRSGSTMLLEIVASHPAIATHRYRDLWSIYTPYWSRDRGAAAREKAVERSHGDGILVTPDSPEAMEEILWMTFFDGLHDSRTSNILDNLTENPTFESFYVSHLKKLLLCAAPFDTRPKETTTSPGYSIC